MYSQDPKVRRRQVKLRFFSYGVMTLATVVLATAGLYYVLGYRLSDSFELERGSLVKFDSQPRGADITIDGTVVSETPYQANLSANTHTVSYSREGYQGWQKTVTLRPGEVRWLNYARLLPTSITTSPIQRLEGLHQAKASPDRQYYLLHEMPGSPQFNLVDVSDEDDIQSEPLTIPASVLTAAGGTFSIVGWSQDSDYILVRHALPGGNREFIRVPRAEPEESINLTSTFGLQLHSVQFANNTAGIVFAKDAANTLYRLDLSDPGEPLVIAENVSAFDNHNESQVAFVSPATISPKAAALGAEPQGARSLKVWQRSGQEVTELRSVPGGVPVSVAYREYFNTEYIALVAENSISVIEGPLADKSKVVLTDAVTFAPAHLASSPGNRFFLVQRGADAYVYDIELDKSYQFAVPNQPRPLQWLDDHHLAFTGGGNLQLIEFDGTNRQFVTSIRGNGDVLIASNNEILLSIGTSAGMPAVQRSFLLNEDDR